MDEQKAECKFGDCFAVPICRFHMPCLFRVFSVGTSKPALTENTYLAIGFLVVTSNLFCKPFLFTPGSYIGISIDLPCFKNRFMSIISKTVNTVHYRLE